jgi:glycosyltransferase involved in cell wall biosynthesis
VFVGSLSGTHKGLHVLLSAMRDLSHVCPVSYSLTVLGDGDMLSAYRRMSRELGLRHVVFRGYISREKLIETLDASDIYVHPSLSEGLPRSLLEAMARGLPCVATRVGGIPSVLRDEGLVVPDNPASLATRLCRLTCDQELYAMHASRCLDASRRFSYDVLSTQRASFYRYLAQQSK